MIPQNMFIAAFPCSVRGVLSKLNIVDADQVLWHSCLKCFKEAFMYFKVS